MWDLPIMTCQSTLSPLSSNTFARNNSALARVHLKPTQSGVGDLTMMMHPEGFAGVWIGRSRPPEGNWCNTPRDVWWPNDLNSVKGQVWESSFMDSQVIEWSTCACLYAVEMPKCKTYSSILWPSPPTVSAILLRRKCLLTGPKLNYALMKFRIDIFYISSLQDFDQFDDVMKEILIYW